MWPTEQDERVKAIPGPLVTSIGRTNIWLSLEIQHRIKCNYIIKGVNTVYLWMRCTLNKMYVIPVIFIVPKLVK